MHGVWIALNYWSPWVFMKGFLPPPPPVATVIDLLRSLIITGHSAAFFGHFPFGYWSLGSPGSMPSLCYFCNLALNVCSKKSCVFVVYWLIFSPVLDTFAPEICCKSLRFWAIIGVFISRHIIKNLPDGVPCLFAHCVECSCKIKVDTFIWTFVVKITVFVWE